MSIFTAAELQHLLNALPLLKDKGPGWAVKDPDNFARWLCEISVLQARLLDMHDKQSRIERADKIDLNGTYQIDNPAHPNHGEMVTIEMRESDHLRIWFRVRTFAGIRIYNVRPEELRG